MQQYTTVSDMDLFTTILPPITRESKTRNATYKFLLVRESSAHLPQNRQDWRWSTTLFSRLLSTGSSFPVSSAQKRNQLVLPASRTLAASTVARHESWNPSNAFRFGDITVKDLRCQISSLIHWVWDLVSWNTPVNDVGVYVLGPSRGPCTDFYIAHHSRVWRNTLSHSLL